MDNGFEGQENRQRWAEEYRVWAVYPPKRTAQNLRPKALRRWLAGLRQIVETIVDKLWNTFRLDWERPHTLMGIFTCLAAKIALHNFCSGSTVSWDALIWPLSICWAGPNHSSHQAF